jgi:hypothetical protein
VRGDRRVAGGGDDPLVRRQQVVGVGVEVGDAADHRRPGDEVVAVFEQAGHQLDVAAVTLDQRVVRIFVVGLLDPAVLGEVVDADNLITPVKQFFDEVPADEASRPADQNLLHHLPFFDTRSRT